jgi:hypothetical protein
MSNPGPNVTSTSNIIQENVPADGHSVGVSSQSPIGFYGASPVIQPSGNAQVAATRGLACGVVASYNSTQSPSAVSQGTTAEQTLTIQSGSGGQMLLASGDIVYVNKPSSQAGLGVGNCRVSSGNTLGITFINVPAAGGSITPTASEVYSVVGIRGMPKLSVSLSPAAVAANTTVEQQFSVVGLPAGFLVQVNKPTAQAGLDIVGCRVISNNLLGITFANVTSSPITPTAAESYNVFVLPGLDAVDNEICYGFNVGTVGAIGAGIVVSGGSTTLTGLLATDLVAGLFKPTAQAAATNAAMLAYGIPTANTLTLYFTGVGTGATPTASEVYGVHTFRMNPAAPLVNYSQSLVPSSVAAATTAEQTFTVTGLVAGSPVWVNKPSYTPGLGIAGVRVSAANTLAINYINTSGSAIVPPTETYLIGNFQAPSPGAGNVVYQTASPVVNSLANLGNAQRAALVSLGLLAGA